MFKISSEWITQCKYSQMSECDTDPTAHYIDNNIIRPYFYRKKKQKVKSSLNKKGNFWNECSALEVQTIYCSTRPQMTLSHPIVINYLISFFFFLIVKN